MYNKKTLKKNLFYSNLLKTLLYICTLIKTQNIMKAITTKSIEAFLNAETFNLSNTSVEVLPNVTILKLFGNAIAYRYNDPEKTLSITNCGWKSNTTKERLNALPNVNISQKSGKWYLNGAEWGGQLIDLP
jgi:hypothetical protein